MTADGEPGASWASSESVRLLEEAQLALGEGPALDVARHNAVVLEPSLQDLSSRWPFFGQAVLDSGMAAVFAFPLQVGAICLGTLTLYSDVPGFLTDDQLAEALGVAEVVTHDLLDLLA
jgi:hypothetical protein